MRPIPYLLSLLGLWLVLCSQPSFARTFHLYLDTDRANHPELSHSIQKGIEIALNDYQQHNGEHQIKLIVLDHHGNVKRAQMHIKQVIDDPEAIALFSATSSTVLVNNKDYINHNRLLTLVTSASATSITRTNDENWIFRLGLDDARSGYKLIDFALHQKSCIAPQFMIQDTAWGDQNLRTLTKAIAYFGTHANGVTRFQLGTHFAMAKRYILDAIETGDCIVLVGNANESAEFTRAMASLNESQRMPIIAHEAISKGDLKKQTSADILNSTDLNFIQACLAPSKWQSFSAKLDKKQKETKISHPVGFAEAFDLTRLFLQSFNRVQIEKDVVQIRSKIRTQMEMINVPVPGIIQNYFEPFSAFSEENVFAHEALSSQDYCMKRFLPNGQIVESEH